MEPEDSQSVLGSAVVVEVQPVTVVPGTVDPRIVVRHMVVHHTAVLHTVARHILVPDSSGTVADTVGTVEIGAAEVAVDGVVDKPDRV
jgi:hypothetical protein